MSDILSIVEKENINNYSLFDKIIFMLYSAYFILVPFYFWESGIPQLSDILLVFLILLYIIKNKFKIKVNKNSKSFLLVGLIFVSYILFVNLIWTMILNSSSRMIITSIYYIYNYLVAVLVISLFSEYKVKIIILTYRAIIISILVQIIIFFINGGFSGGRMIGSFNNPNQLGYYALITSSIIMFISSKIPVKLSIFIMSLIATFLLIIASLSSTAIAAYIGLVIFFLLSKSDNKKFKRKIIILLVSMILILTIVYKTTDIIQNSNMLRGVQTRMSGIDKKVDGFSDRGYYRIVKYPEYWIFGAGEGEYLERFESRIEFHSTLGNIQVSYGIIGTILFIYFIFLALKNDKYKNLYMIVFIMAYGLTHNGIRNSMLWILLALISISNLKKIKLEVHCNNVEL